MKTLKRAIELAVSNRAILTISVGPGSYAAATGETFPYTVPTSVAILGAPGAILAGTNSEVGLVMDAGSIQSLEFDNFKTAIHVTGMATLTNLTVKASQVGVLADGNAKLAMNRLEIAGTSSCKNIGLQAMGTAQVTIDTFVSSDTISIDEGDQAVVSVKKGTATATTSKCDPLVRANGKSLELADTFLSGGVTGIFLGSAGKVDVTLQNTTIADVGLANTEQYAIIGHPHSLQMTGGEIRNSGGGTRIYGGTQVFTNIAVKGITKYYGIIVEAGTEPAKIKVRGSTITGNEGGIWVYSAATADLGIDSDPGNNTINSNRVTNLNGEQQTMINAVGNIWSPNIQGTNSEGRSDPQRFTGPLYLGPGTNFSLGPAANIQL